MLRDQLQHYPVTVGDDTFDGPDDLAHAIVDGLPDEWGTMPVPGGLPPDHSPHLFGFCDDGRPCYVRVHVEIVPFTPPRTEP